VGALIVIDRLFANNLLPRIVAVEFKRPSYDIIALQAILLVLFQLLKAIPPITLLFSFCEFKYLADAGLGSDLISKLQE
jgi:hypothetical protein